jgi:Reverse transcriptase (RNA-dependent DNA polymerase)
VSIEPAIVALSTSQLREALSHVERANDMLPPREDDKVADRIGARFVEGLRARILAGDYRCSPAYSVPVPKRLLTTRPAAVTTLRDRVVFEALVESARPKITAFLVAPDVLMWPRADDSRPAWNDFERAPLREGGGYIASADVAGYYESIDHGRLAITLADAGVSADVRTAIVQQVGELMRGNRGLPQGVETSDALATAYLAPVDSDLQRLGLTFWRHGDDFQLWAPTYAKALGAIYELEQALRQRGLLLNTGKLKVPPFARYSRALSDVDRASKLFKARMQEAREKALLEATDDELTKAIEAANIDEDMQWRFWYSGTVDMTEMLAALAPSLTPKPIEVVVEMLKDLMSKQPKEALPAHIRHARLTFCLRRLARARSPEALPWVGELLVKRPDETQDLANYMLALISSEPSKVVAACQYALIQKAHLLDWERAWIYRVLSRTAKLVHKSILAEAKHIAESDASNWIARVEAMRLLARAGVLTQVTATQVIRNAPECFKGDIAGIIAMIERPNTWTARYLDGAHQDPLEAVVIDAVRAKARGA